MKTAFSEVAILLFALTWLLCCLAPEVKGRPSLHSVIKRSLQTQGSASAFEEDARDLSELAVPLHRERRHAHRHHTDGLKDWQRDLLDIIRGRGNRVPVTVRDDIIDIVMSSPNRHGNRRALTVGHRR